MSKLFKKLLSSQAGLPTGQAGNTLIQIPVTLAIIAGASVAGTSLADVLPEARDTRRAADAYQVSLALALYYDDRQQYPVYTTETAADSWQFLRQVLEPAYIFEFPQDPQPAGSYRYSSTGQSASVFWFSETEQLEKERRLY